MDKDDLQIGVAIVTLGTLSMLTYSFIADKMADIVDLKQGDYALSFMLTLFSLGSILIISSGLLFLIFSYFNRKKDFLFKLLITGIVYFLIPIIMLLYYTLFPFPYPVQLFPFRVSTIMSILLQTGFIILILLSPMLIFKFFKRKN